MKIPNCYRPVPFWSWNEKLDQEETKRQIRVMHEAGIGGFFMHARGGLQTGYLSEEWFANVEAALEEAERLGMDAWAYDENGWPSGFADGKIPDRGVAYQQKRLLMGTECPDETCLVARIGEHVFYYKANPFYSDNLDPKVVAAFIQESYEPYYARFGNRITGFFTDEPQINKGIPWSFVLPEAYCNRYGEDLIPRLPELFLDRGDFQTTRIRFWKLVTDLFSESYFKQIYDWCHTRGLMFTGHLMSEDSLFSQLKSSGAAMPHYDYFSIPGMDWLGRHRPCTLTTHQLGSAAQQTGKKQVISETFALCGHNVSFDELRAIYAEQMIHGINLLCPHLQGYSIRGIRKRDYPPAMYYQQPWWEYYDRFCGEMSYVGQLLCEGECTYDTLLIHPQTTIWSQFAGKPSEKGKEIASKFTKLMKQLDAGHVLFHLGDETLMERHGRVENGRLIIGQMAYSTVILPEDLVLLESTEKLLETFRQEGGKVISPDEVLPKVDVVDNPQILYTHRKLPKGDLYYFLNPTDVAQTALLRRGDQTWNPRTGEKKAISSRVVTFAPYETLLVLEDGTGGEPIPEVEKKPLDLSGEWTVESFTPNVLTLDACDYYFDGELQERNGYVLNIQDRAVKLERPVQIRQVYHVRAEYVPKELWLVCETPEISKISVNGSSVKTDSEDWFLDRSFRKLNISGMLQLGENRIEIETSFSQSEAVYECQRGAQVFHNMRNKLTYDQEIEACYLIGDFGVRGEGEFVPLERDAWRFRGSFSLCRPLECVTLAQLEQQGFLFFAGKIRVSKDIFVEDNQHEIQLKKVGIHAVSVNVNGQDAGEILYQSDRIDISRQIQKGNNHVVLELTNNLRNMLGPHHQEVGECYMVGPSNFFKEECVWSAWPESQWHDDYCFVETGIRV